MPVLSWVVLRGRCVTCHEPFTVAYPIVELVTAVSFAAAALRIGPHLPLLAYWMFFATLIVVSVIDLFTYTIPDRVIFPMLGVSIGVIILISLYYGDANAIVSALVGMLVYAMLLFLPFVIKPNALGFGDVKLALLMGLFIGWLGDWVLAIRLVLIALIMGCMLGFLIGGGLWLTRKITGREVLLDPLVAEGELEAQDGLLHTTFPFGPALALGAALAILFAPQLLG